MAAQSSCRLSTAPQVGAEIVRRALSYPLRLIASNAGVNGSVCQQRVMESLDANIGYNAATDVYEDLMAAGIIDPTKVPCFWGPACQGARSVLSCSYLLKDDTNVHAGLRAAHPACSVLRRTHRIFCRNAGHAWWEGAGTPKVSTKSQAYQLYLLGARPCHCLVGRSKAPFSVE